MLSTFGGSMVHVKYLLGEISGGADMGNIETDEHSTR